MTPKLNILLVILFIILVVLIKQQTLILPLNELLFFEIQSWRTSDLDRFFVAYTFTGDRKLILLFSCLVAIFLATKENLLTAIKWLGFCASIFVILYLMKYFVYSARPEGFQIIRNTGSFPSGHVGLFSAIIGYWCYLVSNNFTRFGKNILFISYISSLGLLCFSRLYLGAHWFSDIIGSLLLAFLFLNLMLKLTKLKKINHKNLFIWFSLSMFFVLWLGLMLIQFNKSILEYTPI